MEGSFAWANGNTVITESGDYQVIFTPADTGEYASLAAVVHLDTTQLTVTVTVGEHGSADPLGTVNVNYGDALAVTFKADLGYAVSSVTLDGASVEASGKYTVSDIKESHTLHAEFEESESTVSISCIEGSDGCYSIDGTTITFASVTADSVYAVSGELIGNIVIDVSDNYKFELEMQGLTVWCEYNSPIVILNGDKVTLTAKKDYDNFIYDLREAVSEDDETQYSGAIHAECDLDIGGKGSLTVESKNNNGIHTKDDLEIKNLTLTSDYVCVISEELAIYNDLTVGNTIIITNPSLETETYTLTVSGIYTSTATNDFSSSRFGAGQDPANQIYMSANALQVILDASEAASTTVTDDNGRESESKITGTLAATYTFADTDAYYAFEEEVRTLGLDDSYTVSSADITAFENSMTPLNTLSTMAGWFLLVILIIGGIILVVLNIFNVRERKYEVGVLTAMGMKKWKVAAQFICEILVVTMLAVVIGAGIGAVSSVPVTNALLEGQVQSQSNQQNQMEQSFGRPGNMGGGKNNRFENLFGGAADYITEVNSAMNLTVVLQMIGVGLLLTLIASAASVLFIMRYDPLKILANRD